MSQIPEPIEKVNETNEGGEYRRPEFDLLMELIDKFNELVVYLDSISERL